MFVCQVNYLLLIYICNFHVLSHLLLIYMCKLHWMLKGWPGTRIVWALFRSGTPITMWLSALPHGRRGSY